MMKRALLLFALLLPFLSGAARGLPRYPFVDLERNVLSAPAGQSRTYQLFRQKLDTLVITGRGNVRVLHVGGSHVQGGTWTDRLRRNFLALRYGMDGGRGLVFPFAVAQTNTPSSYSSSCTGNWESARCLHPDREMGLCGMAATALDTSARAMIDLLPRTWRPMQQRYTFNRVQLLGYGDMAPVLLLQKKDTLRGIPTADGWRFDLPCYMDWVQLAFAPPLGNYTVRGLYLDKSCGGFTLCEAGVNGASTQSWLNCEDWESDLSLVHPDLVIFSIGINDIQGKDFDVAKFKSNYRALCKMVRRANPLCAILFTGINDSYSRKNLNPHTPEVEKACRELAAEFKGVCWDLYALMGGAGSVVSWQDAGLMQPDKVHFTPEGYRLIGDLLFDAMMK